MKSLSFTLRALALASLCAGSLMAADPLPSLNAKDLAQGPYSAMRMLLEKTILKVDVLTLDMRFNKSTQDRFAELAKGKTYSGDLEKKIAEVAINSDRAVVQLKFERDVPLEKWMDVAKENMDQAKRAGLISAKLQQRVSDSIPKTFAAVQERGFVKGDRIIYDVRPGALRTVVITTDGKVPVDKTSTDADVPKVVLSSYFAPESEFRELLIRSLVKK
jgi:hypothetical protein